MAIPLWTGNVGSSIAPDSSAITRLDPLAYAKGAAAAKNIPTTGQAIAEGITGGIEAYNKVRSDSNRIEAQDLALERARDPEQIALEQQKVQAERDKYAEEVKLRQRRDELVGLIQKGDGQATAQALTSGQFADVFSQDPHLEAYTVKVAEPFLSEDYLSAFVNHKDDRAYQASLRQEKNAEEILQNGQQLQTQFEQNSDIGRILGKNKEYTNPLTFLDTKRFEFVPAGKYTTDPRTHQILVDPSNPKMRIEDTTKFDPTAKVSSYDLIDNNTKKFVDFGIEPETRDLRDKTAAILTQVKIVQGTSVNARDLADLALKQRQRDRGVYKPQGLPTTDADSQPTLAPIGTDAVVIVPPPKGSLGGRPPSEYKKDISKISLTAPDGRVAVSPEAIAIHSASMGFSPEVTIKNAAALQDVIEYDLKSSTSGRPSWEFDNRSATDNRPAYNWERQKEAAEYAIKRDKLIRKMAGDEFDLNEKTLKTYYNEEAVRRTIDIGRLSNSPAYSSPLNEYLLRESVTTPKELYIKQNYSRLMNKYAEQKRITEQSISAQQLNKLENGQITAQIISRYLFGSK